MVPAGDVSWLDGANAPPAALDHLVETARARLVVSGSQT
jgi:hypothetical protein